MVEITKEEAWDEFMKIDKDTLIKWGGEEYLERVRKAFLEHSPINTTYGEHRITFNTAVRLERPKK